MFNLPSRASLGDNLKVFSGADIQIFAPLRGPEKYKLDEGNMRKLLQDSKERRQAGDATQVVEDFTFVSYAVNYLVPTNRVGFSTLPEMSVIRNLVWGVEEIFFNVVYSEYFHTSGTGADGGDDNGRISSRRSAL